MPSGIGATRIATMVCAQSARRAAQRRRARPGSLRACAGSWGGRGGERGRRGGRRLERTLLEHPDVAVDGRRDLRSRRVHLVRGEGRDMSN